MNFLNIHTDFLRSEAYLGAEPIERATWLNLMAWCATQENGGVILGASEWTDRKWQQLCGVTKEEATLVSDLYQLNESGDLVVNHYPKEKEEEVKTKRETAKANGKKGGRPKGKPTSVNPGKPTLVKSAKTEWKGREGNGMERNTPDGVCEGGAPLDHLAQSTPDGIPTIEEAKRFASSDPSMIPPDCVDAWHDDRTSMGWEKPKGQTVVPIRDWRADLRGYGRNWKENRANRPDAPKPPPKAVEGPPGWQDAFREIIPTGPIPVQWSHVDPDLRGEIQNQLQAAS